MVNNTYKYLLSDLKNLKGVGLKTANIFKRKKINNIFDLLWRLPKNFIDRSKSTKIADLKIGETQTITLIPYKYNFPRIRNLPNRIFCRDETGVMECVFFNSYEGYIKKILPLNEEVTISGKINFFNKKYQITNPDYVTSLDKEEYVKQIIPKYSLTKGINEKKYRLISDQVINNLPDVEEWYEDNFLKKNNFLNYKENIIALHKTKDSQNNLSKTYKRLVFDEIFANFLVLSENRKKIKIKKKNKSFKSIISNEILKNLSFELTKSQKDVLKEINLDLKSNTRMFRIIQGDVGTGKTIVSLLSIANVIESNHQCAFMAIRGPINYA